MLLAFAAQANQTIEHIFNSAVTAKTLSFNGDYTIGTMTDGIIYTCKDGARFNLTNIKEGNQYIDYGICIHLFAADSVIISPAIQGLTGIEVDHVHNSPTIQIAISTDSLSWTTVTPSLNNSSAKQVTGLNGNYYIKLKNTGSTTAYISEMIYTYSPQSNDCNCLSVTISE